MEKQQAIDLVLERLRKSEARDTIVSELIPLLKAPRNLVGRFVDEIIAEYAVAPFQAEIEFEEEALTEFVSTSIADLRDSDDIIYDICTRTGWHWQRANDFLIAIQESRLQQIKKRKRRFMLPLGVAIFLVGAVIIYLIGANLWNEYLSLQHQEGAVEISLQMKLTYLFTNHGYTALMGAAMMVGGAFGVGKALTQPSIQE